MEQDNLAKMFELSQKAQGMERIGNDDKALEYYLQIHKECTPNTSTLFENPIRILEKKRRLTEAKEMCERAIDLITRHKITGNLKTFEDKLERINRKLEESGAVQEEAISGFSTGFLIRMLVLIVLVIMVGGLLMWRQSSYDDLEVDLSEMEQSGDIQKDGDPSTVSEEDKEPEFVITDRMLEIGMGQATMNLEVKNIVLSTKETTLAFALIVDVTTSEERIKTIVTDTLKSVSGAASAEYSDLKGPNAGSLGEIYNYYDVIVSVGESADQIIMKGTKSTSKRFISWHD